MVSTIKPSCKLGIKIQRVKTAILAKKEVLSTKKNGRTHSYTFKGNNNTKGKELKEKMANIILREGSFNDTDKQTTINEIVSVLSKDAYKKGDSIVIPLIKPKIKFTKLTSADFGDEVYVVIKTEHMLDRKINMLLFQGGLKKVVTDVGTPIFVTQDGNKKANFLFTAKVGEFAKKNTIINTKDFENHAICKIKLAPSNDENNKKYREGLNKATDKKARLYLGMDAEPENNDYFSVKYEEIFDNRPNLWYYGEGNWFELKEKAKNDNSQYFIYKTGKIKLIKGVNSKNDYLVETDTDKFKLLYTLTKNSHGMVKIPDSGDGFARYGTDDAGGTSGNEIVGVGDRYLIPKTAAALFGIINEVNEKGWEIHLGDMSSDNGSDPWQKNFVHHSGHGHNGLRKGLDVDFRYLNSSNVSYQGNNSSNLFNADTNKEFFNLAYKYGFKKNYCTNVVTVFGEAISGVSNIDGHVDHGHIGLSDINLEEVENLNVEIK